MAEKDCYYARDDQQLGPVSFDDIKKLARSGRLGRDDLMWRPGMDDWLPAAEVPGVFPPAPARRSNPPAPPVQETPDQRRQPSPVKATKKAAEPVRVKIPVAPLAPEPEPPPAAAPPAKVEIETPVGEVQIETGFESPGESVPAAEPHFAPPADEAEPRAGVAPAVAGTGLAESVESGNAGPRVALWLIAAALLMLANVYLAVRWFRTEASAEMGGVALFVLAVDVGVFLMAFAIDRALELGRR
ncbi:MAG: DUF4339 domain-containing protein [Planctomycetales bacterium]|nr:DUF4339 domain-containing protein [Planctomycetales bacterium]